MIEVFTDGACEPVNPKGIATYGFVIRAGKRKLYEEGGLVGAGMLGGDVSNNVAEYAALIRSLEWLIEKGLTKEEVRVCSDSQLVINQLRGSYWVRAPRVVPLFEKAMRLARKFKRVQFGWISREENEEADLLSEKAYRKYLGEHWEQAEVYYRKYFASKRQLRYIDRLGRKPDPMLSKREASQIINELRQRLKEGKS